jgi:hypothetical protein
MQDFHENIILKQGIYQDYLLEVLEGDGEYWFQCRSVYGGDEESDHSGYADPEAAFEAAKIFVKKRKEELTLKVEWPWTMLPLEAADHYIEYLQKQIGPGHPLYKKKVFPSCRREDSRDIIIQFDLDDDETYAIVFFNEKQLFGKKEMPRVEMISSFSEPKERFAQDHFDAMAKIENEE